MASKEVLMSQSIDLIFLDIHLPKLSGVDFLRNLKNPPAVILTTAFSEYALEGYDLNVMDYLLKPFSFGRFIKAVEKVQERYNLGQHGTKSGKDIFVKSGYEYIRINMQDIIYIKADGDYTEIHMSEKKLLSSETLKHWIENSEELDNAGLIVNALPDMPVSMEHV